MFAQLSEDHSLWREALIRVTKRVVTVRRAERLAWEVPDFREVLVRRER